MVLNNNDPDETFKVVKLAWDDNIRCDFDESTISGFDDWKLGN